MNQVWDTQQNRCLSNEIILFSFIGKLLIFHLNNFDLGAVVQRKMHWLMFVFERNSSLLRQATSRKCKLTNTCIQSNHELNVLVYVLKFFISIAVDFLYDQLTAILWRGDAIAFNMPNRDTKHRAAHIIHQVKTSRFRQFSFKVF